MQQRWGRRRKTERAPRGGALVGIVEAGDRTAQAPIRRPSRKRLACEFAKGKLDLLPRKRGGREVPKGDSTRRWRYLPTLAGQRKKDERIGGREFPPLCFRAKRGGLGSRFPDRRGRESDLPAGRRRSRLFVYRLIPGDGMSRLRVCKQTRPAAAPCKARRQESSKGGFDAPLALPANSRRTEKKGRTDRRARV